MSPGPEQFRRENSETASFNSLVNWLKNLEFRNKGKTHAILFDGKGGCAHPVIMDERESERLYFLAGLNLETGFPCVHDDFGEGVSIVRVTWGDRKKGFKDYLVLTPWFERGNENFKGMFQIGKEGCVEVLRLPRWIGRFTPTDDAAIILPETGLLEDRLKVFLGFYGPLLKSLQKAAGKEKLDPAAGVVGVSFGAMPD